MKHLTISLIVMNLLPMVLLGQYSIEWSEDYEISIADYRDTPPKMAEDNVQMFNTNIMINMNYAMGAYQFMLTKNFNKYVSVDLYPMSSWMEEGEYKDNFIAMANLSFDLAEVYARRLRKAMYENKKAFSNAQFYQKESQRLLDEYSDEQSVMYSELISDFDGHNVKWKDKIIEALNSMPDYCKECKPQKKKKK